MHKGVRVTRVGLLQLVPAEEGSFLLLAEVRALLQEPVGDPTLADPWMERSRVRSIQKEGWDLLHTPTNSVGQLQGSFVGPDVAYTNLLPEQPPPGRCVCSPGTT